jgi:flagellar basal-body rod protein FlgC
MALCSLIPGSEILESSLKVYQTLTQASVQNLANKDAIRTPSGLPYQEQAVLVESLSAGGSNLKKPVCRLISNKEPGPSVYDPRHPEADASGMVRLTNVNRGKNIAQFTYGVHMTKLMLSCYRTVSSMARDTFEIFS